MTSQNNPFYVDQFEHDKYLYVISVSDRERGAYKPLTW